MKNTKVTLVSLMADDREQFILDNQWAFKHGAMIEFGERDDHIDNDGEIISRDTIERCIDDPKNETYRIVVDGKNVGGVILKINKETHHNELEILFTLPDEHSKAEGTGASGVHYGNQADAERNQDHSLRKCALEPGGYSSADRQISQTAAV